MLQRAVVAQAPTVATTTEAAVTFWDQVPWFLPGVVIVTALTVGLGARLARRAGISRPPATAVLWSAGVIVAATLTPYRDPIVSGTVGSGSCDLSRLGLPSIPELIGVVPSEALLNILLFAPLGVAVAFVPGALRRTALVLAAAALPVAIEAAQLGAPILARGCQSADVVDNLTGLFLGFGAGSLFPRDRH